MARALSSAAAGGWLLNYSAAPAKAGRRADVQAYITEKGAHVVRIEEHWKIRVAYPDPANGLPEFLFVLTPNNHFRRSHMVLAINHQLTPRFSRGGIQLLAYDGTDLVGSRSRLDDQRLWEVDDDIEIRFAMTISNGNLKYELLKVKGKTWGDNKDQDWCHIPVQTSQTDLDDYDAASTHIYTGCANGVHTLEKVEVMKVRYTFDDGKDIDADDYKTKIEYQPSVIYKTYDEYKASLEAYKQ